MERDITGFHRDELRDWVAELSCGHDQHVRHRPPFTERPWVLSAAGRHERIGTPLECPLCDRAELPATLCLLRTSPRWSEETLPGGLREAHHLAAGSWGLLHVHEGRLQFSMATRPPLHVELVRGSEQAIPPEIDHEVGELGEARLSIEFFVVDRSGAAVTPSGQGDGGDGPCWAGEICPECGSMPEGSHRAGCVRSASPRQI